MKKMLSLLTSVCMLTSAVSFTASAEEYEHINVSDFSTGEELGKALSNGIKDGRYFADFDGNGIFDPVDALLLLKYYSSASLMDINDIDWSDAVAHYPFSKEYPADFLRDYENYEKYEWNGETFVYIPVNNEMLENVKKYGDIDNNGYISANDAAYLLAAYYYGFESGDVNTDNQVNASDASYVLHYYSSKSTGQSVDSNTEQAMEVLADVNGDGEINASDATEILSTYSELAVSE